VDANTALQTGASMSKGMTYKEFRAKYLPNYQALCQHCWCRVIKWKYARPDDWKCCHCDLVWSEKHTVKEQVWLTPDKCKSTVEVMADFAAEQNATLTAEIARLTAKCERQEAALLEYGNEDNWVRGSMTGERWKDASFFVGRLGPDARGYDIAKAALEDE
jgi:hypothetical protein